MKPKETWLQVGLVIQLLLLVGLLLYFGLGGMLGFAFTYLVTRNVKQPGPWIMWAMADILLVWAGASLLFKDWQTKRNDWNMAIMWTMIIQVLVFLLCMVPFE